MLMKAVETAAAFPPALDARMSLDVLKKSHVTFAHMDPLHLIEYFNKVQDRTDETQDSDSLPEENDRGSSPVGDGQNGDMGRLMDSRAAIAVLMMMRRITGRGGIDIATVPDDEMLEFLANVERILNEPSSLRVMEKRLDIRQLLTVLDTVLFSPFSTGDILKKTIDVLSAVGREEDRGVFVITNDDSREVLRRFIDGRIARNAVVSHVPPEEIRSAVVYAFHRLEAFADVEFVYRKAVDSGTDDWVRRVAAGTLRRMVGADLSLIVKILTFLKNDMGTRRDVSRREGIVASLTAILPQPQEILPDMVRAVMDMTFFAAPVKQNLRQEFVRIWDAALEFFDVAGASALEILARQWDSDNIEERSRASLLLQDLDPKSVFPVLMKALGGLQTLENKAATLSLLARISKGHPDLEKRFYEFLRDNGPFSSFMVEAARQEALYYLSDGRSAVEIYQQAGLKEFQLYNLRMQSYYALRGL